MAFFVGTAIAANVPTLLGRSTVCTVRLIVISRQF